KNRISLNKHRLYRDAACISALQDFLDEVARRVPGHAGASRDENSALAEPKRPGEAAAMRSDKAAPRHNPAASPAAASVDADLRSGVALHERGQLAEAEAIYRNTLRLIPDHFDAI